MINRFQHTIDVLQKSQRDNTFPYELEKSGVKISVFENVFSPKYFGDSQWVADNLPLAVDVREKKCLEIGTGTGLIAIKLAQAGALKVTATDIVENTLNNAKFNVEQNNLSQIIDLKLGDVFEPVKDKKFDIIFWNIPFTDCADDFFASTDVDSGLLKSCFSPSYNNFYTYLRDGFNYLMPDGRLLMGFSPKIADETKLAEISIELGLEINIITEGFIDFDGDNQHIQILEFKKI